MSLKALQERYDNMLPDDTENEISYTGEIWVKGILFEYEDGILQHVTVPSEMWPLSLRECEALQMIADGEAAEQ